MTALKTKKRSRTFIGESTMWAIVLGIVVIGLVGFLIWMQSAHH